ncbi:MAG TPA: hypothetical protein VJ970_00735 [Flavobacteriaceae bacterium]|nr:hypothetical protein [Flavobacteriaceae bacterium]
MKKITLLLLLYCFSTHLITAQTNKTQKNFGITWSGFVKTDVMFDTRQTINAREGHFMILPANENYSNGNDINSETNFNILSIQSRLRGTITGPDFFGMQTSGVLEAAFFGNSNETTGEFRLRHAFVKLDNKKLQVLIGQYWNPMFITAVFPSVYSFNTGVPFQPFARNPQIRVSTKGNVKLIGAIYTERDFKTRGASVSKSGLPQFHAQLQYNKNKTVAGLGFNYKTAQFIYNENVKSKALVSYFKTNIRNVTWKVEGFYGENMSDVLQLGGFGLSSNDELINNKTFSAWTEFMGDFTPHIEWGIFSGFTKNKGFDEEVIYQDGFLANTVKEAFRVSPRIGWKSGNLKIGFETEYTNAQFANLNEANGVLNNTNKVDNIRFLITAIYKF